MAGSSAAGRDDRRSIRLFHSCVTRFRRRERNIEHKTRGHTHQSPGFCCTTAADVGGQTDGDDEHGSRRKLAVGGGDSAAAVSVPWRRKRAAVAAEVTQERIHSADCVSRIVSVWLRGLADGQEDARPRAADRRTDVRRRYDCNDPRPTERRRRRQAGATTAE